MGDMVGRRLQREGVDVALAPYAGPEEAVAALTDDPATDALLIDNVTLRQAQGAGAAIAAVGPALESNPYVIVLPLTASDLQEQVEVALAPCARTVRWRSWRTAGSGMNQVDRIRRYERPSFFAL